MTWQRVAPIFPVRDLAVAREQYRALGFVVDDYDGGAPYAYARRDGIEIHLTQVPRLKPRRNLSAAYLDSDANLIRFGSPLSGTRI